MTNAFVAAKPASATLPECPMRGIDHLAFVTDDMLATMDFHTRDNAERVCNFHARPSALRD